MRQTSISVKADIVAGGLAIAFGISVLLIGWTYPVGTATNMGPGYIPRVLGALSVVFGLILSLRRTSERIGSADVEWRAMMCVLASVVVFAALIQTAGLPLAIFASVLVSSTARQGSDIKATALLAVVVAASCTGLFVFALGLPMRLTPWN